VGGTCAAKESHEGVIAADEEKERGRRLQGKNESQPEISISQQAQRAVEPLRHLDRFQQDQLLNRTERADAATERASEKQSHGQRQEERRGNDNGNGVFGIGERHRDILNGTNGTDAALAVESE